MPAELHARVLAMLAEPSSGQWLDLVVQLRPVGIMSGAGRTEAIAQMRADFQVASRAVRSAIEASGGSVEGEAWINFTLTCRVPAATLETLLGMSEIVLIDVPQPLSRERQ
jgi:hypothetical protein